MSMMASYISAPYFLPFSELVEALRQQGFSFGVETYEMSCRVMISAIESDDLASLDLWLCPVFAHSAEQQAVFMEVYKRNFKPTTDTQPGFPLKEEKPLITEHFHSPETSGNSDSLPALEPAKEDEKEITVASLKARSSTAYALDRFVRSTPIVSDPVLLKVVRQLRFTEHSGRYSFNIEKTIQKTIHCGGMAKPVYTAERRHIEYLMLIDRHNLRDHQAQLHNSWYETLKENNIFVERFYFDNSPLLCRNDRHVGGISLSEILSLHEHAALMIFADGLQFIDTYNLNLFAWADIFKHWQHRYFLTSYMKTRKRSNAKGAPGKLGTTIR